MHNCKRHNLCPLIICHIAGESPVLMGKSSISVGHGFHNHVKLPT